MNRNVERFSRWAPTYERHRLQRLIFEPVQQTVLDQAASEVPHPRSILDVGCGTGRLLRAAEQRFPGARLEGVDAAPGMVNQAKSELPAGSAIEFQQAAAEHLPFPDGQFDLAFSTMTFHHWEDQRRGVAEIGRVLTPDGRWVLADYMVAGVMRYIRRLLRMSRFPERAELDAMLAPAGLSMIAERRPSGFFARHIRVLAIGHSS